MLRIPPRRLIFWTSRVWSRHGFRFAASHPQVQRAVASPSVQSASSAVRPRLGTEIHGFKVLRAEHIAELDAQALVLVHRCGAKVVSISSADENKTFVAAFRTPVTNGRGMPHILEHSVLCGSRKFPVKAPLAELMKGSLATFVNAFTFSDRTIFPVASCNLRDFYNLVHVYLDAVLHPRAVRDPNVYA
eukprot:RCo040439